MIPQTRGSSKSLPAAAVLRQVEGFVAAGGNELVLSGINLGRWGRDLPFTSRQAPTLAGLVRADLRATALPRLRLSSIEPMDWDAELIGLMAEFGGTRLARHAHLPLQSGSDAVLRRMHRRYRPWHYAEKVEALLRAAGPELTLGADVMVGFPGRDGRRVRGDAGAGAGAALRLPAPVSVFAAAGNAGMGAPRRDAGCAAAVEERMAALRALAAGKSETHRRRFVGRELEAITLHTPAA